MSARSVSCPGRARFVIEMVSSSPGVSVNTSPTEASTAGVAPAVMAVVVVFRARPVIIGFWYVLPLNIAAASSTTCARASRQPVPNRPITSTKKMVICLIIGSTVFLIFRFAVLGRSSLRFAHFLGRGKTARVPDDHLGVSLPNLLPCSCGARRLLPTGNIVMTTCAISPHWRKLLALERRCRYRIVGQRYRRDLHERPAVCVSDKNDAVVDVVEKIRNAVQHRVLLDTPDMV
jgi:hypothetical protein